MCNWAVKQTLLNMLSLDMEPFCLKVIKIDEKTNILSVKDFYGQILYRRILQEDYWD